MNIEYNHPLARDKIRILNRLYLKDSNTVSGEIDWTQLANGLLEKFFPVQNHIWAHFKDESYVNVLELTLTCLEYGLFNMNDKKVVDHLVEHVYKASLSLRKLEDSWRDKYVSLMQRPDSSPQEVDDLNKKLDKVSKCLTKSKEYLAKISVQIMTLYYDDIFGRIYEDTLRAKKISTSMSDSDSEKIKDFLYNKFPFNNQDFYNKILHLVMNYLSEFSKIGQYKISSDKSKRAVEKAFMYVTTLERDCFISSIKGMTNSDYMFFDLGIDKKDDENKFFAQVREEFIDIIDAVA